MQEFLSGERFEEMAREYNAKYNSAEVLASNGIDAKGHITNQIEEEKEKYRTQIDKDFEDLISLFLFIKKYIKVKSVNLFSGYKIFCFNKLEEIEKKIEKLKCEINEFLS